VRSKGYLSRVVNAYSALVTLISVGTTFAIFSGRTRSIISARSSSSGKVNPKDRMTGGRGISQIAARVTIAVVRLAEQAVEQRAEARLVDVATLRAR